MREVYDHKGQLYCSVERMCWQYGISTTAFYKRLQRGYTLEKALTLPVRKNNITRY